MISASSPNATAEETRVISQQKLDQLDWEAFVYHLRKREGELLTERGFRTTDVRDLDAVHDAIIRTKLSVRKGWKSCIPTPAERRKIFLDALHRAEGQFVREARERAQALVFRES